MFAALKAQAYLNVSRLTSALRLASARIFPLHAVVASAVRTLSAPLRPKSPRQQAPCGDNTATAAAAVNNSNKNNDDNNDDDGDNDDNETMMTMTTSISRTLIDLKPTFKHPH